MSSFLTDWRVWAGSVVILGLLFLWGEGEQNELNNSPKAASPQSEDRSLAREDAPPRVLADNATADKETSYLKEERSLHRSAPFSHSEIKELESVESFLSEGERRKSFLSSELNSSSKFMASKQTVLDDEWLDSPGKDKIVQRVAALKVIKYSKHLRFQDCKGMVSGLVKTHEKPSIGERKKRLVRLDLYSVVKSCASRFPRRARGLGLLAGSFKVKSQIIGALRAVEKKLGG